MRRTILCLVLVAVAIAARPRVMQPAATSIVTRSAVVDGLTLQFLEAGSGPVIVLLHGYAETSRMWRPLIPQLAGQYRVIAPDLPGIGESAIPNDGLDMKMAATRIHALVPDNSASNRPWWWGMTSD